MTEPKIQVGRGRPNFSSPRILDRDITPNEGKARPQIPRRRLAIGIFIFIAICASAAQIALVQQHSGHGTPQFPAHISLETHDPVVISQDADFLVCDAVRSGDGTPANPYVISDWEINASTETGITISSTEACFIIRNVTLSSITLSYDGIQLNAVRNGTIENVTITDCYNGISVNSDCKYVEIVGSTLHSNQQYGIVCQWGSTSYLNITGNNCSANLGSGIDLNSCSYFRIVGNNITTDEPLNSNRRGLTASACSYGTLSGNQVWAKFSEALWFNGCTGAVVEGNRISSFSYGIYLNNCVSFLMYHNNFVGSATPQASDSNGAQNAWNISSPIGGNYWIDYTGIDDNGDGFGDDPYVIDGNSADYLPLMSPGPIEPIPEFSSLLVPMISLITLLVILRKDA